MHDANKPLTMADYSQLSAAIQVTAGLGVWLQHETDPRRLPDDICEAVYITTSPHRNAPIIGTISRWHGIVVEMDPNDRFVWPTMADALADLVATLRAERETGPGIDALPGWLRDGSANGGH